MKKQVFTVLFMRDPVEVTVQATSLDEAREAAEKTLDELGPREISEWDDERWGINVFGSPNRAPEHGIDENGMMIAIEDCEPAEDDAETRK